jgi:hypothetical protein
MTDWAPASAGAFFVPDELQRAMIGSPERIDHQPENFDAHTVHPVLDLRDFF